MLFTETVLAGAFTLDPEPRSDARGHFARLFCARELAGHGLNPRVVQCHMTVNPRAGTLRGMHWQTPPAAETKIVRCTRGAIFDVIVDLRPGSPTYGRHVGVELSADTGRALYVPGLFGHGYQTLADDTEVAYLVSEFYAPAFEQGFRHDDPAFGIDWPLPVTVISAKDRSWAPFGVAEAVPT
jgi:dTDP-4-dehydrorhamnose 3,5-epimerase